MESRRLTFSQRHPFIFGLLMIFLAMVMFFLTMAFFSILKDKINISFFQNKKIGIVNIKGTILNSRDVIDWLDTLKNDDNVLGIIVRLDSPGGAVAPSQEIYEKVKEIDKKKPVIASMGSVAASGAYYIAVGTRYIVANPGTITGSIGVLAKLVSIEDVLKKLGIKDQTITSGKFKDTGSPLRDLTTEEKKYLQSVVNDLYEQFLHAVSIGRKIDVQKIRPLADGRVFTGKQAKEIGLVDELGNLDHAIYILKKILKIKQDVDIVEGPKEKKNLIEKILGIDNLNHNIYKHIGFYYLSSL